MKVAGQRGVSLAEIAVIVGILAILFAIAVPAYFRYRGHQGVNNALEMTEGFLVRGREEAKSSGYALPEALRTGGVPTAAASGQFGAEGGVSIRLRKRYRAGEPVQTVSSRDLSLSTPVTVEVSGLGRLDLDADPGVEGVFFEILTRRSAAEEILATIPIEVNGEMLMHGANANGMIRYSYNNSYTRAVEVTARGVVTPDRR